MDTEVGALAVTAAGTMVNLLATDAWQIAKTAMAGLWRRFFPDRVAVVEAELVETRAQVLAARAAGDLSAERALVDKWRGQLLLSLIENPNMVDHLRQVLDGELLPAASAAASWTGDVTIRTVASDGGRNYVVGQGHMNVVDR